MFTKLLCSLSTEIDTATLKYLASSGVNSIFD